MSFLLFAIVGLSLLLWLFLARKLLERLSIRYFLSEDEITTAFSRYDRDRHRPTYWVVLAIFQFFSLISLSLFVSMVIGSLFGLGISFAYVFLGNLFISLPICFFGLHVGALEKTESPLRLLSQKRFMRVFFSLYAILFATFSVITFSLLLTTFVPPTEIAIIVIGFSILFLLFEGWNSISESRVSGVGVVLAMGALGCGIVFWRQLFTNNFTEYLVPASILLIIIAYTEFSSTTQRYSFLLLSFGAIAFFLVLVLSFVNKELFFPITSINLSNLDIWVTQKFSGIPFVSQYPLLKMLPIVLMPSVASGFLAIISWQGTAKQIENDTDVSRVTYLSMFLVVTAQILVLIFAASMPNIENLLLSNNFFERVLVQNGALRQLVYTAIVYMALLVIAPAFRLANATVKKIPLGRVTKGILYPLIVGGTFLFLTPEFAEESVFLILTLFGSASVGVSAIYMALANSHLKSEELETKWLTLITLILFIASIVGFLLVTFELLPAGLVEQLKLQDITARFLLFILTVIAIICEIILVIRIQTRGLGRLTPLEEET